MTASRKHSARHNRRPPCEDPEQEDRDDALIAVLAGDRWTDDHGSRLTGNLDFTSDHGFRHYRRSPYGQNER